MILHIIVIIVLTILGILNSQYLIKKIKTSASNKDTKHYKMDFILTLLIILVCISINFIRIYTNIKGI